jgi:hypothetical protein
VCAPWYPRLANNTQQFMVNPLAINLQQCYS